MSTAHTPAAAPRTWRWLLIGLALCLVSMVGAARVQNSAGEVDVRSVSWVTGTGRQLDAMLFVPEGASAQAKRPAIVTTHGWFNNKEMQDMNFVEYARRGYVVLAFDMYAHGNSDPIPGTAIREHATGMTDAVEYTARLPYVDTARIGITGHSNGARAANWAILDDNAKSTRLVSAVLLVANEPTYVDQDKKWTDVFGSRSAGVVAAQYDEFFFRTRSKDAPPTAPRDYIRQPQAQSFLKFGTDPGRGENREAGTLYRQNVDGKDAVRVIYTPKEIHPWNTISSGVASDSLAFFDAALGQPVAMDPGDQVWGVKMAFNTLGLIGFGIVFFQLLMALLATPFFASLRAPATVAPLAAPTRRGKVWFWCSLVAGQVFAVVSYLKLFEPTFTNTPSWVTQQPNWYIGMWAVSVAAFTLLLLLIGRLVSRGDGVSWRARGLSLSPLNWAKSLLLAALVVAGSYLVVFCATWAFGVDFRAWVLPLKAFPAARLVDVATYMVFFLCFYVVNSVAINVANDVGLTSRRWVNIAVLALVNVAGVLVMLAVQYGTFFATGLSWTEQHAPSVSNIVGIWLFPMVVYFPAAAVFDRLVYRRTNNPFLPGLAFGLLVAVISCTNTITFVA